MKVVFSVEEKQLISLLKVALSEGGVISETDCKQVDNDIFLNMAQKHAVLPLLYDVIQENIGCTEKQMYVEKETKKIVLQSYRLLFLTKYVVDLLDSHGIKVIVLKGVATAGFYSVPELRKSGDVDLLLTKAVENKRLSEIMMSAGFQVSKDQHANHHMVYVNSEGIAVEIHSMLAEPFAYKKINRAMRRQMEECDEHIQMAEIMGVNLPILDKSYHAYELLLHMLQHFMYAGFGLKLLCDWIMIWRQDWSEKEGEMFRYLVKESGLEKFAEGITEVCAKYLGMDRSVFPWPITVSEMADNMLREILDSEEFGNADENRMVMMSGTGLTAYMKEFQHQMHLNFPKAGKCFLLWPVLWVITLVRFLKNNKQVRNTSTTEILKEAKRRSELMERLKLMR